MTLSDRISEALSPHLGAHSADAVARHICAKYGFADGMEAGRYDELREFLRRGLVAFVGAEAASELAAACVKKAKGPPPTAN